MITFANTFKSVPDGGGPVKAQFFVIFSAMFVDICVKNKDVTYKYSGAQPQIYHPFTLLQR